MDEQDVRQHAQDHLDALIAGNVDQAIESLSPELRRNLGEIMAMLPLPLTGAEIESLDKASTGYTAVFRLTGETDEIRLETRWKDRDGRPTIVEASHLTTAATEAAEGADATEAAETAEAGRGAGAP
jgi:hypothetical protein